MNPDDKTKGGSGYKTTSFQAVQGDARPTEDPKCRERFNKKELQFLEDLGKYIREYPDQNVTRRFRLLACPLRFADDCCPVWDEQAQQWFCGPCQENLKFAHQPEHPSQTA